MDAVPAENDADDEETAPDERRTGRDLSRVAAWSPGNPFLR